MTTDESSLPEEGYVVKPVTTGLTYIRASDLPIFCAVTQRGFDLFDRVKRFVHEHPDLLREAGKALDAEQAQMAQKARDDLARRYRYDRRRKNWADLKPDTAAQRRKDGIPGQPERQAGPPRRLPRPHEMSLLSQFANACREVYSGFAAGVSVRGSVADPMSWATKRLLLGWLLIEMNPLDRAYEELTIYQQIRKIESTPTTYPRTPPELKGRTMWVNQNNWYYTDGRLEPGGYAGPRPDVWIPLAAEALAYLEKRVEAERAEKSAGNSRSDSKKESARNVIKAPLTDAQQAVLDILQGLGPKEAKMEKELADVLEDMGIYAQVGSIRGHIIPALKAKGINIKNKGRVGYYIASE